MPPPHRKSTKAPTVGQDHIFRRMLADSVPDVAVFASPDSVLSRSACRLLRPNSEAEGRSFAIPEVYHMRNRIRSHGSPILSRGFFGVRFETDPLPNSGESAWPQR